MRISTFLQVLFCPASWRYVFAVWKNSWLETHGLSITELAEIEVMTSAAFLGRHPSHVADQQAEDFLERVRAHRRICTLTFRRGATSAGSGSGNTQALYWLVYIAEDFTVLRTVEMVEVV